VNERDYHKAHKRIDEIAALRHKEVDEECARDHEALDRAWSLLTGKPLPPRQDAASTSNGNISRRFYLKEAVEDLVAEWGPDTDVYLASVYDGLLARYPFLRSHPKPKNLKAQIAGTLSAFFDEGLLELVREGSGSIPNIFRLATPVDEEPEAKTSEPAVATAGSASKLTDKHEP
jgi:hypothetical protein